MQIQHLIVIVRVSNFLLPRMPKDQKLEVLGFRGAISSGRICPRLGVQRSVVAVPEQRCMAESKGMRLHDRFRIALEESVALVSWGGIAMRGRLSRIKRKWSRAQC